MYKVNIDSTSHNTECGIKKGEANFTTGWRKVRNFFCKRNSYNRQKRLSDLPNKLTVTYRHSTRESAQVTRYL